MSSHGAELINLLLQLAPDNQTRGDSVSYPRCTALLAWFNTLFRITWWIKARGRKKQQVLKMTSMNEDQLDDVAFFFVAIWWMCLSLWNKIQKSEVISQAVCKIDCLSLSWLFFSMVVHWAARPPNAMVHGWQKTWQLSTMWRISYRLTDRRTTGHYLWGTRWLLSCCLVF